MHSYIFAVTSYLKKMQDELERAKEEQLRSAKVASLTGDLLKAMSAGSEDAVQDALRAAHDAQVPLSELVRTQDYAGMTAVHVAARLRRPDWLQDFLRAYPAAASLRSFATGKPEGWTPLHCVLGDKPASMRGL